MKRFLFCVAVILIVAMAGCSKKDAEEIQETPDFSDYYLLGFDFGGAGFGEPIDTAAARVVICTDHTVQVSMPHMDGSMLLGDYEVRGTLTLTDEQYSAIENLVDRDRLWNLDVDETEIMDGVSRGLVFYDDDLNAVAYYGGFVSDSDEEFWTIYRGVLGNVPVNEINDIRIIWLTESYAKYYGDDRYANLSNPEGQMQIIFRNDYKWIARGPEMKDWYANYAVTDFDGDGYFEMCVCKTYNNGPSSIMCIYEVTEEGIMTEFDTGSIEDYPDLVIDHYTEPIGLVRDDEGNCFYHVCNIVDNGIEGAEHRYGVMYFENNTMYFDESTEQEYNDTQEEVMLGWFSDITSENISDSYNVFVNGV